MPKIIAAAFGMLLNLTVSAAFMATVFGIIPSLIVDASTPEPRPQTAEGGRVVLPSGAHQIDRPGLWPDGMALSLSVEK